MGRLAVSAAVAVLTLAGCVTDEGARRAAVDDESGSEDAPAMRVVDAWLEPGGFTDRQLVMDIENARVSNMWVQNADGEMIGATAISSTTERRVRMPIDAFLYSDFGPTTLELYAVPPDGGDVFFETDVVLQPPSVRFVGEPEYRILDHGLAGVDFSVRNDGDLPRTITTMVVKIYTEVIERYLARTVWPDQVETISTECTSFYGQCANTPLRPGKSTATLTVELAGGTALVDSETFVRAGPRAVVEEPLVVHARDGGVSGVFFRITNAGDLPLHLDRYVVSVEDGTHGLYGDVDDVFGDFVQSLDPGESTDVTIDTEEWEDPVHTPKSAFNVSVNVSSKNAANASAQQAFTRFIDLQSVNWSWGKDGVERVHVNTTAGGSFPSRVEAMRWGFGDDEVSHDIYETVSANESRVLTAHASKGAMPRNATDLRLWVEAIGPGGVVLDRVHEHVPKPEVNVVRASVDTSCPSWENSCTLRSIEVLLESVPPTPAYISAIKYTLAGETFVNEYASHFGWQAPYVYETGISPHYRGFEAGDHSLVIEVLAVDGSLLMSETVMVSVE